jgi:hypothetical protein
MISPELNGFIKAHENDDVHELALHAKLYPEIDIQTAIRQIAGRKTAKVKIPGWYANESIIYPQHISIEQSSSEETARYKAALAGGNNMVDLTGGMGVDFSFMAAGFAKSVYVEQQPELTKIAEHNFKALRLENVSVENADSQSYLQKMPPADLIYIDPARRNPAGQKTVRIEDCTPDILEIENLLDEKSRQTMIKLSPMLDIALAVKSLAHLSNIHIISCNNECKELLFIKNRTAKELHYHCANIQKGKTDIFSFTREQEDLAVAKYARQPKNYLYEPNPSIMKAGAYKYISTYFDIEKLHPNSHLYTSDSLAGEFHGRSFTIENIYTLNKKDIRLYLNCIGQANITTRTFPLTVQELRKRTGIKEGGDTYIFATTLADEKKVLLICKKVE